VVNGYRVERPFLKYNSPSQWQSDVSLPAPALVPSASLFADSGLFTGVLARLVCHSMNLGAPASLPACFSLAGETLALP
jgi:hypothetical protein